MRFARVLGILLLGVGACSKSEKAPTQASSETPATAPASASAQTDLLKEPEIVHEPPVSCTWTGNYAQSFGQDVPEFSCKSDAKKPLEQIVFWVYYYDEQGKLISRVSSSLEEGKGNVLGPGETKKLAIGRSKPHEPIHAKAIEVEAWRGTYADGERWENPDIPEDREMVGPKPGTKPDASKR